MISSSRRRSLPALAGKQTYDEVDKKALPVGFLPFLLFLYKTFRYNGDD